MYRLCGGTKRINHKNISELLNLPKGTEVLLINDKARPAYEAIAQLQALGINHIKYYPYFPGGMTYPQIDIAVTVGEPKLVPHGFNRVIDIGTRQIDITTFWKSKTRRLLGRILKRYYQK